MSRFAFPPSSSSSSSCCVSSSAPAPTLHRRLQHRAFRTTAVAATGPSRRPARDRTTARSASALGGPHFPTPATLAPNPIPQPQRHAPPHPETGSCPEAAPCSIHGPPRALPAAWEQTLLGRRTALAAAAAAAGLSILAGSTPSCAAAAELALPSPEAASAQVPTATAFVQYIDPQYKYEMAVPSAWEKIDKAGANVLFEDPGRRSSSLGVTVNPVRVTDIGAFGSLEQVGDKLIQAEKKKESTLSASMLSQSTRQSAVSGALLYDFEYDLDSTRGRKRILNTVTIFKSKLYILNGTYKCEKADEGCSSDAAAATLATLRSAAASFSVV